MFRPSLDKDISAVLRKKQSSRFPTSDTNRAVRPEKMARGWKFRIPEVEELYYLSKCSIIKGADQQRGYRVADLRLCFRKYKKQVFLR